MSNALKSNPIVVFTGGGTGGHIYPNLALIPDFEKSGYSAVYVGGEGEPMEKRLAKENGIKYYGVPCIKLMRSLSLQAIKNNLFIPFILIRAVKEAKRVLSEIAPSAVFSKGGFVALPVVIAARMLKIPIFVHESDLTLGLANKIAKLLGATVLKANPHAKFKGLSVGMPLRRSLFSVNKRQAREKLHIATDKKVLLVLGGSSGAKFINDAVFKNIKELTKNYFVLHVVGKGIDGNLKYEKPDCPDYMQFEYADDIALFYAASDAILSRAGATAVFEIAALKLRAVFVPLPKGASRGDQRFNAELAKEFGGTVLYQDDGFQTNFLPSIAAAFKNPPMRPVVFDANGKIVTVVCDSLSRGVKCKDKKLSLNGSR